MNVDDLVCVDLLLKMTIAYTVVEFLISGNMKFKQLSVLILKIE